MVDQLFHLYLFPDLLDMFENAHPHLQDPLPQWSFFQDHHQDELFFPKRSFGRMLGIPSLFSISSHSLSCVIFISNDLTPRLSSGIISIMNRLLWVVSFALSTPCVLVASILLFLSINTTSKITPSKQVLAYSTSILESSENNIPTMTIQISKNDGRTEIIRQYLAKYHSSLEPFSKTIVETADKYSLDYRLLVAIAQQESNLCKKIPTDSHNCWGFGIYADKITRFENYTEAIQTVSKTLKKDYLDKGLVTPEQIMAKYTPPSQGSWAAGVSQFLAEIGE